VDCDLHRAVVELVEVEMGPKDGWSGPSAWRRLAGEEEGGRLILRWLLAAAQLGAELQSASGKRCAWKRLGSMSAAAPGMAEQREVARQS
jgi:hypothetical protein